MIDNKLFIKANDDALKVVSNYPTLQPNVLKIVKELSDSIMIEGRDAMRSLSVFNTKLDNLVVAYKNGQTDQIRSVASDLVGLL